jgi:hypothetical protein
MTIDKEMILIWEIECLGEFFKYKSHLATEVFYQLMDRLKAYKGESCPRF